MTVMEGVLMEDLKEALARASVFVTGAAMRAADEGRISPGTAMLEAHIFGDLCWKLTR